MEAAIKGGADVNAKDEVYGYTALMRAAENNKNPEVVATLLKNGADANAKDNRQGGKTALMYAAIAFAPGDDFGLANRAAPGNLENVAVLLKNGADVNAKNSYGRTALIDAADNNTNPEIISILLKNGADARVKDNEGKRAIDYANYKLKEFPVYRELEKASK